MKLLAVATPAALCATIAFGLFGISSQAKAQILGSPVSHVDPLDRDLAKAESAALGFSLGLATVASSW